MITRARRVLLIEDDEVMRESLADVLSEEGYDVRAVPSADDALSHLDWPAHLIVLDLTLPGMSAQEFRNHQRNLPRAALSRVLVLSASRHIQAFAAELDADAWIAKPFDLRDLLDTAERLASSH